MATIEERSAVAYGISRLCYVQQLTCTWPTFMLLLLLLLLTRRVLFWPPPLRRKRSAQQLQSCALQGTKKRQQPGQQLQSQQSAGVRSAQLILRHRLHGTLLAS